jgi:hypothetical protein
VGAKDGWLGTAGVGVMEAPLGLGALTGADEAVGMEGAVVGVGTVGNAEKKVGVLTDGGLWTGPVVGRVGTGATLGRGAYVGTGLPVTRPLSR